MPHLLQRCVLPLFLLLVLAAPLAAQNDLENVIRQYDRQTIAGYIQPLADLLGANMNGGFYHTAAIPTAGLNVSFKIVGTGGLVGDDMKSYTLTLPASFTQRTMEAPTIFGGTGAEVVDPLGTRFRPSDGIFDASLFPTAIPQLTVGSVYGTEAVLRFAPIPEVGGTTPSATLFSVGARHSISQYLMEFPLDLAVGFYYSSYTAGDIIDLSGLSIGANASKSFAALTVYGGVAWESSTMKLDYTGPGSEGVDIELDGENSFRFTGGLSLRLAFLILFADANVGAVTNISAGLGFGI